MTQHKSDQAQLDLAPDVFDMDRPLAPEPPLPPPAAPSNGTGSVTGSGNVSGTARGTASGDARQGFADKVKPRHFTVLAGVVALIWIGWPDNTGRALHAPVPPPGVLSTEQRQASATPAASAGPDLGALTGSAGRTGGTDSSAPSAIPDPRAGATSQNASPEVALNAQIVEAQAQQATALVAAIDEINTRLAAMEAREQRTSQLVAALLAPRAPVKPRQAAARRADQVAESTPDAPAVTTVLNAYSINTMYTDQAWVQHGDQIHVVQAGDTINGIKVLRIDARLRRVQTSHGIIR